MLENIKDTTKKDYIAKDDKNTNSGDEYKDLLYDLKELKDEIENPAFVYYKQEKNKQMDDFYLEAKRDLLKVLLQRAQILSPQQYTKRSWGNFIGCMRQAMQMAKCGNAQIGSLNSAVNLMYRAILGLRYNYLGKNEFKNFKKSLPNDNILHKKANENEQEKYNTVNKISTGAEEVKDVSTVMPAENLDVQI